MFILPIEQDNPCRNRPYTVWALVAINVAVFVSTVATDFVWLSTYGFRATNPSWTTLVFSMFLHAGFGHIAGNMFFLWMFGDNVEDVLGPPKFLAAYFLTGLAAAAVHALTTGRPDVPLVGASGAVSGVMGMYLVLDSYTRFDLHVFIWRWHVTTFTGSALVALAVWLAEQTLLGLLTAALGIAVVAFWAHVAGFAAGVVFGVLFGRTGFPTRASERVDLRGRRFD
jgi:membrane associated rhomboid family serine protease